MNHAKPSRLLSQLLRQVRQTHQESRVFQAVARVEDRARSNMQERAVEGERMGADLAKMAEMVQVSTRFAHLAD